MAETDDPVKIVEEAIVKHQERVFKFYKTLWKRIKSVLAPLKKFLKDLLSAAKTLIKTVGKTIINRLTSSIRTILDVLNALEKDLKSVTLLGKRILATIRKETDQLKTIRFLKTVVRKYVDQIKRIKAMISDLSNQVDVLNSAALVLQSFGTVLSFLFNWISAVIKGLVLIGRTVGRHLKQGVKLFAKEQKDAILLLKNVAKMKLPKPG